LAASAGGFTTLVDMPLNSIPSTTTVVGLKQFKMLKEFYLIGVLYRQT